MASVSYGRRDGPCPDRHDVPPYSRPQAALAGGVAPSRSCRVLSERHVGIAFFCYAVALAAKCAGALLPANASRPSADSPALRRCASRFVRAFSPEGADVPGLAEHLAAAMGDSMPPEHYADRLRRLCVRDDAALADACRRLLSFLDDGMLLYNHPAFFVYMRCAEALFPGQKARAAGIVGAHFAALQERFRAEEAAAKRAKGGKDAVRERVILGFRRLHPDKYGARPAPEAFKAPVDALYMLYADAYAQAKEKGRTKGVGAWPLLKLFGFGAGNARKEERLLQIRRLFG